MTIVPRFLLPFILAGALCSCQTSNRLLHAGKVPLSPFIEHAHVMTPARDRVPFNLTWRNFNRDAQWRLMKKTDIYIAPVTLRYLRPVKQKLVKKEIQKGLVKRNETGVARQLRAKFANAFIHSPSPRYRLAMKPGPNSVTLELAIVELNPTSAKGNAVKTAAKFIVGPLAGLGGIFTKGNIAIEGKVRNSATGELIFQFADNEADKMTFYSARDFKAYGHATVAMDEWAAQFEEFTRTMPDHRVHESKFFTLSPW
ncbi:MAG: DUF3313 domain-containing protein [Verrucomicrobiaceae bacterium]|nr:DUF3313 domain-containing protein [Verrucomicrobiaceae bacterium]